MRTRALFPGDTDADQTWRELKALLEMCINKGLAGQVSIERQQGQPRGLPRQRMAHFSSSGAAHRPP
jgi:hypothetical protein